MDFDVQQMYGLLGIPVVVGLTQVVKQAFPQADNRFWPAVSLALGVALNLSVGAVLGLPLGSSALLGLVVGLSASGLYSHVTTLLRSTTSRSDAPLPPTGTN